MDQALDWFGLDAQSITEQQVKDAFKLLAKKFHPDASSNYKGKMDNYENFILPVQTQPQYHDMETCNIDFIIVHAYAVRIKHCL